LKKFVALSKLKQAVIHPLVFAVFPVLSLYVENVGKGFLREALAIAAGVLIFAALLWLFIYLLIKDKNKSAIITSAFFVLFFSYGHIISACGTVLERMQLLDKAGFLVRGNPAYISWLIFWIALFAIACYATLKLEKGLFPTTNFLNVVTLMLVVMLGVNFLAAGGFNTFLMPHIQELFIHTDLVRFVKDIDNYRAFLPLVTRGETKENSAANGRDRLGEFESSWQASLPAENSASGSLPDIYYIILDMYARADYLEEIYYHDNDEFLSFLTDKGFYIASESRSNYPYSTHSLAASLNFMYLDEVVDQVGNDFNHFGPSITMFKNNRLVHLLRNHGYTTVAFATGYWFTEITDADVYMEPPGPGWHPSEFQGTLIRLTPLTLVPILRKTQGDVHRERVLYTLDHIADGTRIDSPTFVFAHVVAPHPPYAFGPNGEAIQSKDHGECTYDEYIERYRNQVVHVNKRMQTVIEEILSQSPEPPIIIIQSDHGPCYGPYYLNIPERMSILNAYYFPDQNYEDLYEDITPVNTFRIVLNNYFGANYELLEDKSYFASWDHPYLFIDVTDEVLAGN
jgi:hypothetical protein